MSFLVPLVLLIVPLAEIAVFILVGERIGVGYTLLGVFITAIAGSILLRVQGFGVITRIRHDLDKGVLPGRELAHAAMIVVAGILLLTPGFVTDALGLLLFVPPIRDLVMHFMLRNVHIVTVSTEDFRQSPDPMDASARPDRRPPLDGVIDLDEDEYKRNNGENTDRRH